MSSWKRLYVKQGDPISAAIAVLERGNSQISLVVDQEEYLLGTVTDGDIRRGLLRGLPLTAPIAEVMNRAPIVIDSDLSREAQHALMLAKKIRQLPIVDADRRLIGLALLDEMLNAAKIARDNWVVLMAGGYGTRLRPLTETTPKPLLRIGDKPLLERTLESLIGHNFNKFMIAINYKATMLKDHFGNGEKWGVQIEYLEEEKKLGTAGALSLIKVRLVDPIIVVNGDVVTHVNYANLLDFHLEQQCAGTMCVRTYDLQIPFGVVRTEHMRISSIEEKPEYRFLVNAGIYVLSSDALAAVPANAYLDMPDLFNALMAGGHQTSAFPIMEYWIDVGRIEDFHRANADAIRLEE